MSNLKVLDLNDIIETLEWHWHYDKVDKLQGISPHWHDDIEREYYEDSLIEMEYSENEIDYIMKEMGY
jgi:hypothetical protein